MEERGERDESSTRGHSDPVLKKQGPSFDSKVKLLGSRESSSSIFPNYHSTRLTHRAFQRCREVWNPEVMINISMLFYYVEITLFIKRKQEISSTQAVVGLKYT